ncbi:formyltransferase family protein, partial [Francisella tularensis]|uniref:formyltransferase family protein n=1 Tax=Francisella tularensis TaxID=263 RepID=UPI002381A28F
RAIQAGDTKSGFCIMQLDAVLDNGDILYSLEIEIQETDTSQTLNDKFAKLSNNPLLETLENIEIIKPEPQQEEPTYAH